MITEAAVDIIHFPVFLPPQSLTIYHRFYDPVGSGSAPAGATLFQLGADPGIAVWMSSGKWQAFHYNGSSSVSSAATVVTTATDLVEHRITLAANGSIQLHQSIDGATEASGAASGALALAAAWSASKLQLGASTAGASHSSVLHRALLVARGTRSRDECREWLP